MTPHDMYKWRNYCPWSVQLRPASSACELRAEVSPPSCTAGWEWHMFRVCLGKKTDNASIREPELGKARVIVITIAVKSSPRGPIRWYDFCNGLSACQGDTNQMHLYEHKCSELEWYSLICTLELTSWPSQQTQNLQIPKCHHLAANIQQVTSIHCKVQLLFMLYPTTPRWTLYIYLYIKFRKLHVETATDCACICDSDKCRPRNLLAPWKVCTQVSPWKPQIPSREASVNQVQN